MPKSKAHEFIGTVTGVVSAVGYCYYYQHDRENVWQIALGGAIGGYTTARLADVLEPSRTLGPNHRGVFHGIALNGTVVGLSYSPGKKWLQSLVDKANDFDDSGEYFKAFLCRLVIGFFIGALGGQISHLLADLTTPKRLPLFA